MIHRRTPRLIRVFLDGSICPNTLGAVAVRMTDISVLLWQQRSIRNIPIPFLGSKSIDAAIYGGGMAMASFIQPEYAL